MVTFNELKEIFEEMFKDEINPEVLSENALLVDDLGMNSISMLFMSLTLEERFNIKFDNTDFASLKSVSDVINIINSKK